MSRRWPPAVTIALAAFGAASLNCATVNNVLFEPTPPGSIRGVEEFEVSTARHSATDIDYDRLPPAGGPHDPIWQNCGIYAEELRQEHVVHSQEHGAVWITYRPDLSVADIEHLREVVRGRAYVILSPYATQDSAVVASAWGVQLRVEEATDERIEQFIVKYAQGPQTPEPGAACEGGVGAPIDK
jgi:hypothetical protein